METESTGKDHVEGRLDQGSSSEDGSTKDDSCSCGPGHKRSGAASGDGQSGATIRPETSLKVEAAEMEDFSDVEDLLSSVNLPHEDLRPSHMAHFYICRTQRGGGPLTPSIVGTAGLEPLGNVGLLRSLAVRPSWRGDGVGGRLTKVIERHARQLGIQFLYLLTTTAAEFFRQHGYKEIPRRDLPEVVQETEEASQICPSSATCMAKRLPPTQ